jgi:hypothetical protein
MWYGVNANESAPDSIESRTLHSPEQILARATMFGYLTHTMTV